MPEQAQPKKRGPKKPSKYKPELADRAMRWYAGGATELEVADRLRISRETLYEWKRKHKEFSDAATIGRQMADDQVEAALFKKATGYTHKDTHFATAGGQIISEEYDKHYPPDTQAAQFWLKNRKPGQWRDKQEMGFTDKQGEDLQVTVNLAAQIAQQMRKKPTS